MSELPVSVVEQALPMELPPAMAASVKRFTGELSDPVRLKFIAMLDGMGVPVRTICEQAECSPSTVIAARRVHPETVETGKEVARAKWSVIRDLCLEELLTRFKNDGAKGASLAEIGLLMCQSQTKIGEFDGQPGLVVRHEHAIVSGPQDWRERFADLASDCGSEARGPKPIDIEALPSCATPPETPSNLPYSIRHDAPMTPAGASDQVADLAPQQGGGGVASPAAGENPDGLAAENFPPQRTFQP